MHLCRALALLVALLLGPTPPAESLTTPQIFERTLAALPNCLQWRWIGNCFWSDCDLLGCDVQTSMKVRHYRPDLLTAVHRTPESMPWLEMRNATHLSGAFGYSPRGGHVATGNSAHTTSDLRFFEASVYGHPLTLLPFAKDQLFCEPVTRPAKPYYQSSLDALAWRGLSVETVHPAALTPGRREIGVPAGTSWGAVYPRNGNVVQQSPVKAAAVVAQRACDIVIGPRYDHIALPLEPPARYTTVPSQLNERDAMTGSWQMISPKVDSDCQLFGSYEPDWDRGRLDESQAFLWNLWRPYECCEPRGDVYLGAVHF